MQFFVRFNRKCPFVLPNNYKHAHLSHISIWSISIFKCGIDSQCFFSSLPLAISLMCIHLLNFLRSTQTSWAKIIPNAEYHKKKKNIHLEATSSSAVTAAPALFQLGNVFWLTPISHTTLSVYLARIGHRFWARANWHRRWSSSMMMMIGLWVADKRCHLIISN